MINPSELKIYDLKKLKTINPYELGLLCENPYVKSVCFLDEYSYGIHKIIIELPENKHVAVKIETGNSTIEDYFNNMLSLYTNKKESYHFYFNVQQLLDNREVKTVQELKEKHIQIYQLIEHMVSFEDITKPQPFITLYLSNEDRYLILTEPDYNKGILF